MSRGGHSKFSFQVGFMLRLSGRITVSEFFTFVRCLQCLFIEKAGTPRVFEEFLCVLKLSLVRSNLKTQ